MTQEHSPAIGDLTSFVGATVESPTWDTLQAETQNRYGGAWEFVTHSANSGQAYQTERGIRITRLIVRPTDTDGTQSFRCVKGDAIPPTVHHFAQNELSELLVLNESITAELPKGLTNPMKTTEIYASPWLKAEDLQGKTVPVKIAGATIESLPQQDGSKQTKVVVSFVGKSKKLILNKTQHTTLVQITGSDDTDDWHGADVFLSPGVSAQGKGTINLAGVPVKEGEEENPF